MFNDIFQSNVLANLISCLIPNRKIRHRVRSFVRENIDAYLFEKESVKVINRYAKNLFIPEEEITPKIIWQYWAQGINHLPPIVRSCLNTTRRFAEGNGYELKIITNDNISEYISLEKSITNKIGAGFTYTNFSDLLRATLLYNFGGIWLDATILITGDFEKILNSSNRIFYVRDANASAGDRKRFFEFNKSYFRWDEGWRIVWLNSIIKAPKSDPLFYLLSNILSYYWMTKKQYGQYFLMQMYFDQILNRINLFERFNKKYNFLGLSDIPPHYLQLNLGKTFDDKGFQKVLQQSPVHKLTYKVSDKVLSNKKDLYYYILKNY